MYLRSLQISGFRNLAEQSVDFDRGVNFICGRNGEGKTNLLEAIYVLSLSKSFRTNKLQELVGWDAESATIYGVVEDVLADLQLGVVIEGNTRRLFLNHKKVPSVVDYLAHLTTVTFSPMDLALVKGAPAIRRSFLDKHIADLRPGIMKHLMACHKAVASKNLILKEPQADLKALDSWNVILAQSSIEIARERKKFLSALEEKVNDPGVRIGAQDGKISFTLESNIPDEIAESDWKNVLEFLRNMTKREVHQKRAHFGPQRDEVLIMLDQSDTRAFASQGQTRSIVLSVKLAVVALLEEQQDDSPVLLLDDVDSELDSERRDALFNVIFSKDRQVVITGTDTSALTTPKRVPIVFMKIENGRITG